MADATATSDGSETSYGSGSTAHGGAGAGAPPVTVAAPAGASPAEISSEGRADEVFRRAPEFGRRPDRSAAVTELVELAGSQQVLTKARDRYALRLHTNSSDFDATAALNVLNPAVAAAGWDDTYDWKRRLRKDLWRKAGFGRA